VSIPKFGHPSLGFRSARKKEGTSHSTDPEKKKVTPSSKKGREQLAGKREAVSSQAVLKKKEEEGKQTQYVMRESSLQQKKKKKAGQREDTRAVVGMGREKGLNYVRGDDFRSKKPQEASSTLRQPERMGKKRGD